MNAVTRALATVLASIVGLAVVSVILSKNATTAQVITAGGTAFSGALTAAEAPVG